MDQRELSLSKAKVQRSSRSVPSSSCELLACERRHGYSIPDEVFISGLPIALPAACKTGLGVGSLPTNLVYNQCSDNFLVMAEILGRLFLWSLPTSSRPAGSGRCCA